MSTDDVSGTLDVTVAVTPRGEVAAADVTYARDKVARVVAGARAPVLAVEVVLTQSADPAVARPARAEATLDVTGHPVRAHALAPTMHEAVDLLEAKLVRGVRQHQERERTRHRWIGVATEGEWRRGDLPTLRSDAFPRPPEEREVVRRKTFALEPMTVDEAAYEMDLLGHDFYLFRDVDSGTDAVVYRDGDGRFAIRGTAVAAASDAYVTTAGAAPQLSEPEARARLDLSGEPFLFYLDEATGAARVLYIRYDGHYGLITSAAG